MEVEASLLDESRFSRQLFVLGKDGLASLISSSVLIIGADAVGAEAAKNLVLSGVPHVALYDGGKVDEDDVASQAFLHMGDVGSKRAAAVAGRLTQLREGVEVVEFADFPTASNLGALSAVVAAGGPEAHLAGYGALCRAAGVPFVAASCRGAFARVFSDFGPSFKVLDADGEPPSVAMLESVSNEAVAKVTTVDERPHMLQPGDMVRFWGVGGMPGLAAAGDVMVTVTGPYTFEAAVDTTEMGAYTGGGYCIQVKGSRVVESLDFSAGLVKPSFAEMSVAGGAGRAPLLHAAHRALDAVLQGGGPVDGDALAEAAASLMSSGSCPVVDCQGEEARRVFDGLAGAAGAGAAPLCPVAAIAGAIAAQEVTKAVTRRLMPLNQWLYLDGSAALPPASEREAGTPKAGGRHVAQAAALGAAVQSKLESMRVLIVGLGGIGCEVLKNFAVMGVATADEGGVTIMDAAPVQRSNLSRSVLWREGDAGRNKADAAAEAALRLNEGLQITSLPRALGEETVALLGEDGGVGGLDVVVCAADNAAARLFCDEKCVAGRTAMVDGGAVGAKGSVHVVVPHQSEQWSRSSDPPERGGFPICVLRNFPYLTDHAIAWAREHFDALFTARPTDVNAYLEGGAGKLLEGAHKANPRPALELVRDSLGAQRPLSFQACIEWARWSFEQHFCNQIRQLLHSFPVEMRGAAGGLFWGGTKRPPSPLSFDPEDPLHLEYVVSAANLQARVYGLTGNRDTSYFRQVLGGMEVPEFVPSDGVKIAVTDAEVKRAESGGGGGGGGGGKDAALRECEQLVSEMPMPSTLAGYRLVPVPYAEEGEAGGPSLPLDFISAAANLRARNYGIPPGDSPAVRQVAGRALPSLAATTSLVAGLVCLEICKLAAGAPLDRHRNTFVNLAAPLYGEAEPVKCEKFVVKTALGAPLEWTLWDRIEMDARGLTLEEVLAKFTKEQGLEVSMVSYGKSLLYAEFLPKSRMKDRLCLTLPKVVEAVAKAALPPGTTAVTLSCGCTDADGEDVEVPDVRLRVA